MTMLSIDHLFILLMFIMFMIYLKKYIFFEKKILYFFSFFLMLLLSCFFFLKNSNFTLNLDLLSITFASFFKMKFDFYSLFFCFFLFFITMSVVEFSFYYMENEKLKNMFFVTLIFFMFMMLILILSENLLTMFIGWEGVGIFSFILISWWYKRNYASSSALQAITYNRFGDMGMFIMIMLMFLNYNSASIFFDKTSYIFFIGLMLASMSKSAQIFFHPWLPSAMEGPTPVSALLHSSTMVVAGVYLSMRFNEFIFLNHFYTEFVMIIGLMTIIMASLMAINQTDMKKIIAYSTTSQLGLMFFTTGLGLVDFSFFHLFCHGFFKALLFLCSGVFIHMNKDEQDYRKFGAFKMISPFTFSCFFISSLILLGFPFYSSFYSKDFILEWCMMNNMNFFVFMMAMLSVMLTSWYSILILKNLFLMEFRGNVMIHNMEFKEKNIFFCLFRLLLMGMFNGWLMLEMIMLNEESFFETNFNYMLLIFIMIPLMFSYNNNFMKMKMKFFFMKMFYWVYFTHFMMMKLLINIYNYLFMNIEMNMNNLYINNINNNLNILNYENKNNKNRLFFSMILLILIIYYYYCFI